jgi:hypothetical protein
MHWIRRENDRFPAEDVGVTEIRYSAWCEPALHRVHWTWDCPFRLREFRGTLMFGIAAVELKTLTVVDSV